MSSSNNLTTRRCKFKQILSSIHSHGDISVLIFFMLICTISASPLAVSNQEYKLDQSHSPSNGHSKTPHIKSDTCHLIPNKDQVLAQTQASLIMQSGKKTSTNQISISIK